MVIISNTSGNIEVTMCNPIAIMGVAVAVSTITSIAGTVMSANAANDAADRQTKSAQDAAAIDMQQLQQQQEEANAATALDKTERLRQAMKERAALRSSSADGGVAGISPDSLEQNSYMSAGNDISILEANRSNFNQQTQLEKQAVRSRAQSRINEAQAGRKSGWATGLQIVGQVAGGVSKFAGLGGGSAGGDTMAEGGLDQTWGEWDNSGSGAGQWSTGEY